MSQAPLAKKLLRGKDAEKGVSAIRAQLAHQTAKGLNADLTLSYQIMDIHCKNIRVNAIQHRTETTEWSIIWELYEQLENEKDMSEPNLDGSHRQTWHPRVMYCQQPEGTDKQRERLVPCSDL